MLENGVSTGTDGKADDDTTDNIWLFTSGRTIDWLSKVPVEFVVAVAFHAKKRSIKISEAVLVIVLSFCLYKKMGGRGSKIWESSGLTQSHSNCSKFLPFK